MKIFFTGVTGYIGGSAAARCQRAGHDIAGLVRSREKAAQLKARGIEPIIGSLSDHALLAEQARAADAVVNAADADDRAVVDTLIDALAGSGKRFIHTSGSSIVATDAQGERRDDIYDEDAPLNPVPERAARVLVNQSVIDAAKRGVHSIIICPTLIYGRGLGLNELSIQVPRLLESALSKGVGLYIGKGENLWSNVHIEDLADLYLLALERAPAGSFFYAENGESNFKNLAVAISRLVGHGGRTQSWPLAEAIAQWGDARTRFSLASNSRVRAKKARELLGWKPNRPSLTEDTASGQYLLRKA